MLFLVNALVAVGLIILILLQRADTGAGAAFGGGSGGAQPVIRNPLAKPTALLAGVFLFTSLLIAYTQQGATSHASVVEDTAHTAPTTPALPAAELPITMDGANGSSLPSPAMPAAPAEQPAVQPTLAPEAPVTP